jgi:hypothetical protein
MNVERLKKIAEDIGKLIDDPASDFAWNAAARGHRALKDVIDELVLCDEEPDEDPPSTPKPSCASDLREEFRDRWNECRGSGFVEVGIAILADLVFGRFEALESRLAALATSTSRTRKAVFGAQPCSIERRVAALESRSTSREKTSAPAKLECSRCGGLGTFESAGFFDGSPCRLPGCGGVLRTSGAEPEPDQPAEPESKLDSLEVYLVMEGALLLAAFATRGQAERWRAAREKTYLNKKISIHYIPAGLSPSAVIM